MAGSKGKKKTEGVRRLGRRHEHSPAGIAPTATRLGRRRRAARILAILLAVAMLVPLLLGIFVDAEGDASGAVYDLYSSKTIKNGIHVGGIDLSGLTEAQAEDRILEEVDRIRRIPVTLRGGELPAGTEAESAGAEGEAVGTAERRELATNGQEMGLYWANPDVLKEAVSYGHASNVIARYKEDKDLAMRGLDFPLDLRFDDNALAAVIDRASEAFGQAPKDATLSRQNGGFIVQEGQNGYTVDQAEAKLLIQSTLMSSRSSENIVIDLPLVVEEPRAKAAELMQVQDLLGSYTTSYPNSGSNRVNNIANGCRLVNGHTVYPGETFSVLEAITPFTQENGYYLAGSYLGAQVVESFGGGICQVSTTLYNAVIRAELEVVERYNHSMIINYVEPSMDAAIAESSGMDFKFRNNLDHPVYIEGYTSGKNITFNVFGVEERPAGRQVRFISETLDTIVPEGEKIYTDSTQPVGYISVAGAHTGYKAQLWKVVTEDGVEVSREVFNRSTYNPAPISATVGTAGNVYPALQAAIESGSIEGVKAALAAGEGAEAPLDAVTAAAQEAAQAAFAAAMAEGADESTAMALAQAAAEASVAASMAEQAEAPAE